MLKQLVNLLALALIISCGGIEYSKDNKGDDNSSIVDNSDNSVNHGDGRDDDDDDNGGGPTPEDPDCSLGTNGPDGPGGFEWLPEDRLKVRFPALYARFNGVTGTTMIGTTDEAEFLTIDSRGRQVWQFPSSGDFYTGRVTADTVEYGDCLWAVTNPSEAHD